MKKLSHRSQELIVRIISGIFLIGALMSVLYMSGRVSQHIEEPWNSKAPIYFGIGFLSFGIYELIFFIYKMVEEKGNKFVYARIAYFCLYFILSILSFVSNLAPRFFSLVGAAYFLIPIAKRIVSLIKKHKAKNLVLNIIIMLVLTLLSFICITCIGGDSYYFYILAFFIPGAVIVIAALGYILMLTLSNFKSQILLKIVRKTYTVEVLLGLLIIIFAFSVVLMMIEPNITNFADALWYCFMLITTIGFGDLTSVTIIGRLLSVILGIYGIVVVAIVTSIIVNFYNEIKDDDEDEDEKKLEENETKEIEEIIDSSEINPVQTNNTEEE